MEEILIPIAFFASIFGIVYVVISARNKERLAMIEKGVDAGIFAKGNESQTRKYSALMFGILFIGVSLGLITGVFMRTWNILPDPINYFAMILLFGGTSLLVYYSIVNRKEEPEESR